MTACSPDPHRSPRAVARAVAKNAVLHCARLASGALQQTFQRGDTEVDGGQRLEHAAVTADRRPNWFTDDGFTHASSPSPKRTNGRKSASRPRRFVDLDESATHSNVPPTRDFED